MTDRILAVLEAASSIPWWDLTPALAGLLLVLLTLAKAVGATAGLVRTLPQDQRDNVLELAFVAFFLVVTGALIMEGIVGFARDEMGLGPVLSVAVFFGLDGVAGFFAVTAYRWAKVGGAARFPRAMVLLIIGASAWFQWVHAENLSLPAQTARAAMPLIAALLIETLLISRRKAWKQKQPRTGNPVPVARWVWDPAGSAGITRRRHLWAVPDWEDALELHMIRLEAIRRLRREFGWFWFWKVPAHVAVRLRKGFRVPEAAAMVDDIITGHQDVKPASLPGLPPERDPRVRETAVEHYKQLILEGRKLPSERGLCDAFDVPTTNRRWAKEVKKDAETRATAEALPQEQEDPLLV